MKEGHCAIGKVSTIAIDGALFDCIINRVSIIDSCESEVLP